MRRPIAPIRSAPLDQSHVEQVEAAPRPGDTHPRPQQRLRAPISIETPPPAVVTSKDQRIAFTQKKPGLVMAGAQGHLLAAYAIAISVEVQTIAGITTPDGSSASRASR